MKATNPKEKKNNVLIARGRIPLNFSCFSFSFIFVFRFSFFVYFPVVMMVGGWVVLSFGGVSCVVPATPKFNKSLQKVVLVVFPFVSYENLWTISIKLAFHSKHFI